MSSTQGLERQCGRVEEEVVVPWVPWIGAGEVLDVVEPDAIRVAPPASRLLLVDRLHTHRLGDARRRGSVEAHVERPKALP